MYQNGCFEPQISVAQKAKLIRSLTNESDLIMLLSESRLPVMIWNQVVGRLRRDFDCRDRARNEVRTLLVMALVHVQTRLAYFIDQTMGVGWESRQLFSPDKAIPVTLYRRLFRQATFDGPTPLCFRSGHELARLVLANPSTLDDLTDCFDAMVVILNMSGVPMNDDPRAWAFRNVTSEMSWCRRLISAHKLIRPGRHANGPHCVKDERGV